MATELEAAPIVIYGAPRSGTTYLVNVLNKHPDVFITNETRIFVWVHEALRSTDDQRVFFRQREPFVEHLHAVLPDLVRDFYRKLSPGTRLWGDKNPHYADPVNRGSLETILALFPATRFVHIIRDGRDVVTSRLRRRASEFDDVHAMWTDHVDIGRAFGDTLPPAQYREVRYEDFVRDDLAVAGALLEFLGVGMHPLVARFLAAQQRARTPFSGATRDLKTDATVSDWDSYWSPQLRLRSLDLLGPHLVRYNYETEESLSDTRRELERELAS